VNRQIWIADSKIVSLIHWRLWKISPKSVTTSPYIPLTDGQTQNYTHT